MALSSSTITSGHEHHSTGVIHRIIGLVLPQSTRISPQTRVLALLLPVQPDRIAVIFEFGLMSFDFRSSGIPQEDFTGLVVLFLVERTAVVVGKHFFVVDHGQLHAVLANVPKKAFVNVDHFVEVLQICFLKKLSRLNNVSETEQNRKTYVIHISRFVVWIIGVFNEDFMQELESFEPRFDTWDL